MVPGTSVPGTGCLAVCPGARHRFSERHDQGAVRGAGYPLRTVEMRRTWDALAGAESAVYVGDPATGAEELAGLFGRLGADPRGGRCVELGCGPGRMTGALAERFDEVLALDVSPAMLDAGEVGGDRAERRVPGRRRGPARRRRRRRGRRPRLLPRPPAPAFARRDRVVPGRVRACARTCRRGLRPDPDSARVGRAPLARHAHAGGSARAPPRPRRGVPRLPVDRSRARRGAPRGRPARPRRRRGALRRTGSAATASCASHGHDGCRARRLRSAARGGARGRVAETCGCALPVRPRLALAQHRHVAAVRRRRTRRRSRRDPGVEGDPARGGAAVGRGARARMPGGCRSAQASSTTSRLRSRRSSSCTP